MYQRGTILTLKKQREPDPETGEPFAYNVVKVIGPSVIENAHAHTTYTGTDARGVIIQPIANFGGTIDEPYGKLKQIYDVTEIPEDEAEFEPKVKIIHSTSGSAGPTPEEVFAEQAPGTPPEPGQRRGRTPIGQSPLEDPGDPSVKSPLDSEES